MSYKEKSTITTILSEIILLAAYCIYAFNPSRLAALPPGDLKPWAVTMLVFIGVGIGVTIVIQIVFHIILSIGTAVKAAIENQDTTNQEIDRRLKREMVEDERDKQIELKATRIGFIVAGIGFVTALLSLVFYGSSMVMLNIMYLSFTVGSVLEGAGQLYYYRRGS
jgi:uncharacterized membrane protein